MNKLKMDKPLLAPVKVWQAYSTLENYQGGKPINELNTLIALIRRVCNIDSSLTTHESTVRKNFQNWILRYHSGTGEKFNEEQNSTASITSCALPARNVTNHHVPRAMIMMIR